EYTPVFCEPAELCVFPVILTVDVIIQDKSPLKSKEAYKKDPEKIRPREEAIRGGGKEIPRTEEERPCKEEMEPQEICICLQGGHTLKSSVILMLHTISVQPGSGLCLYCRHYSHMSQ